MQSMDETLFRSVSAARHADSFSATTSCLGVLTTHSVTPVVANTSVCSHLLQSLNIFTNFADKDIYNTLGSFARGDIFLSIQEPIWHFELSRVVDDCYKFLDLFITESTSSAINIYLCLLADEIRESLSHTSDFSNGEHSLALSFDVRVENTKDVLELRGHLETHGEH
jgi:hypothetical protein